MSGTEGHDPNKPIVEEGMSQDVMDRISAMGSDEAPDLQMVSAPSEATQVKDVEVRLGEDDAKGEEQKVEDKSGDDAEQKIEDKTNDKADQKADDKDDSDDSISLTIKGETKDYSHHQLKAAIGRQSSLAKQLSELNNSEALQLGTLMEAAKGGNKAAAKKVQTILAKAHGKESIDDLNMDLEEVEEEFDETKPLLERREAAQFEEAFGDVKESVDFNGHMDTVKTVLKEKMPEKVFDAYFDNAFTRRTMYDLVASGRMDPLLDAFNQKIESMPFEKQLEIRNDPQLFGDAFTLVVKQENAKQNTKEGEGSEADALDSVSTGTSKSGDAIKPQGDLPDFENMSSEEFAAFQKKNKLS